MKPEIMDSLLFPLHGSRLIEAGAGTGKTYTIAHLYTRLVLGHGSETTRYRRALLPSEILVLTFAEAARLELRDRIRRRLTEAAHLFRKESETEAEEEDDPELVRLRDSYEPDELPRAARVLEQASDLMDEAAIFTIHGWSLRTLRRYAFESGIAFRQDMAPNTKELVSDAVRDYWRITYYGIPDEIAAELTEVFTNPDALHTAITPLLSLEMGEPRYCDTPREVPNDIIAVLERSRCLRARCRDLRDDARGLWRENRDQLHGILRELRPFLNGTTFRGVADDAVFDGWLNELDLWAADADDTETPPQIVEKLSPSRIRLKKGASAPEHPFFAALEELITERDGRDPAETATDIMLHAAEGVRQRLREIKQQRSLLDYNDMLTHLDRALRNDSRGTLTAVIREEFPVVMVDEFQDTDQVQYRIFDRIYQIGANNPAQGIFLIGDPKQAIYRFRGADIFTYLRAREATAGRHYALATNYRSAASLVHATNHLMTQADRHPRGAFLFGPGPESAVPFLPATPRPGADPSAWLEIDGEPAPPVTIWTTEEVEESISSGQFRDRLADQTGRMISHWLDRRTRSGIHSEGAFTALKPADIAVLVRDWQDAEAILNALRRRGVSGVYLSARDSVFSTPEARDVLSWLKASIHPEDTRLIRSALATATMGLPFEELERSARNELAQERHVLRFMKYNDRLRRDGVLPAIRLLLQDYNVSARLLARTGGERSLTNVLHLAEWLHQTSFALENEQDLIRHFTEQINDPDDQEILRLERDDACVRVVTIFKSKGLEYNVVVAPFLCMPPRETTKGNNKGLPSPVIWHDEEYRRILEFRPDSTQRVRDGLEREVMSEEMRLFYVALTRARYGAYFSVVPVVRGNAKQPGIHRSGVGYVLSGGEQITSGTEVYSRLQDVHDGYPGIRLEDVRDLPPEGGMHPVESPEDTDFHARVPRRVPAEPWWIASYTALGSAGMGETSSGPYPPEPESPAQAVLAEEAVHGGGVVGTAAGAATGAAIRATDVEGMHRFPAGSRPGSFLHELIETVARDGLTTMSVNRETRDDQILKACRARGWETWAPIVSDWMDRFLHTPFFPDPSDNPLEVGALTGYQAEMEFLFECRHAQVDDLDNVVRRYVFPGRERPSWRSREINGMFKGFIDLVFFHQDKYYLADWKSNRIGPDDQSYRSDSLENVMLSKRYDMQLALYLLALHRHLSTRLIDYDYDRHIGGALYFFLRGIDAEGNGLLSVRPDRAMVKDLDQVFGGNRT